MRIILKIFYFLTFGCLLSLAIILLLCVFVIILHVSCLFFINSNDHNLSLGSAVFRFHIDIDKDTDCLQSNNNDSLNDLWLLFSTLFFFLKVWFNNRSNIKLRILVILIVSVLLFLRKHIKTPDHHEVIRSCCKHEFFTFDYIDTGENILSLRTQLTISHFSIWKLKYKNSNSFSQLLLLLSGNISLNPRHVDQGTLQCSNEWNVFKNRGLHFIHLNINSLLSKIEELCFIAQFTNAAVIGICESKLDASVLEQDISIDNYKILRCDRNRHRGGVACYIRNDLSYNILSVFPCEIENIFFEILLSNSKPVIVGTICHPPNQNNFLELLNSSTNKINPVDNEIYILHDL